MELPPAFFDGFSRLTDAERQDLSRRWLNRGLVLVSPWVSDGGWLRHLAQQGEAQDLSEVATSLMQASSMTHDEEAQMFDRLLAMVGDLRRRQWARVGEGLLQIAEIIDELSRDPDEVDLGATSGLSPVAVSSLAVPRARNSQEILAQLLANVNDQYREDPT